MSSPPYATIRIGQGIGIVDETTIVLVDKKNGKFGERLWSLVQEGAGLDALLEELSAHGLRTLGDFAMAEFEEDALRVVLRGSAVAVVDAGSGRRVIEATDVRTWVEAVVDDVRAALLSFGGVDDERFPFRVSRGLLPADAVRVDRTDAESPLLDGVDLGWASDFEPTDPSGSDDSPMASDDSPPDEDAVREDSIDEESNVAPLLVDPGDGKDSVADSDAPLVVPPPPPPLSPMSVFDPRSAAPDEEPRPGPTEDGREAVSGAAEQTGTGPDFDFDALYGHTVARSVRGAAVSADADADAAGDDEELKASPPSAPLAGATMAVPPDGAPLIDASPPIIDAPPPIVQPPPAAPSTSAGDHDGNTVSSSRLAALRQQPAGPPASVEMVHAVVCDSGHANGTSDSVCIICHAPLSGSPVEVRRPSLGRLRFTTGESVELDRPAIVGRNPKIAGAIPGGLPHLVKLDIGQALSRSHAAVRLEGWQVMIEDLGSANGTRVTLPGREPQRLRAGEPFLLEDGATVDFGGEVEARFVGRQSIGGG